MINSSSSSPIKILIIHGLNNNLEGFHPLRDNLKSMGFDPHLITLPGHGEKRDEARSFESCFKAFCDTMETYVDSPYVVIAFSQGALFFQLWMQTHSSNLPQAQVLLAPALFIKNQKWIEKLIKILPAFSFIKSQTPKKVRRYSRLYIWEYRTLFEAVRRFQSAKKAFPVPTLVLVDPQDELISVKILESTLREWNQTSTRIELIDRPVIKAPGIGKHHVIFHPDYFESGQWKNLIEKIERFFSAEV